jgi:hypothetical protein
MDSVVARLRSASEKVRSETLRYLRRTGFPSVDVQPVLAELFNNGPPWPTSLLFLLTAHPCTEFQDAIRRLLSLQDLSMQVWGLQYLHLWKKAGEDEFLYTIRERVTALATEATPWVAFLASLQCARCWSDATAWRRAAHAVLEADRMSWHSSIRSAAIELLSESELGELNKELSALNVPVL